MADNSMKISLEGYDTNPAEPEKCPVHPKYPCLLAKPENFGVFEFTVSGPKTEFTVYNVLTKPHGHNFRPIVMGLVWDNAAPDEVGVAPFYFSDSGDGIIVSADATNLKISFSIGYTPSWWYGKTFTVKYYIFAADAE